MDIEEYSQRLTELGIENVPVSHPSYQKIQDVLNCLHLTFADCIPTLIMKADDSFIALIIRGDTKADFKKVKKEFNIKDLRMATPDEFITLTGLPIGAARIYTPQVSKTIIDRKVMNQEYLYGGSGSFECTIKYNTDNLTNIPNSIGLIFLSNKF